MKKDHSTIIKCNHCGDNVPLEKAHRTEWKEINLIWYYCDKCEYGVFGNKGRLK